MRRFRHAFGRRSTFVAVVGIVALTFGFGAVAASEAIDSHVNRSANTEKTGSSAQSRATISAELSRSPGVPLVLPARLPDGYSWLGLDTYERRSPDGVVARSSSFVAWGRLSELPTVQMCSHLETSRTCPKGDQAVERSVRGIPVTIALTGGRVSPDIARFWRTVPLVDSLSVDWLS